MRRVYDFTSEVVNIYITKSLYKHARFVEPKSIVMVWLPGELQEYKQIFRYIRILLLRRRGGRVGDSKSSIWSQLHMVMRIVNIKADGNVSLRGL